jgi:HEAT repeat protein
VADCAILRPDLLAYHDGECAPPDRDRIEAHLHTCQNCQDDVSCAAWEVGLFILNSPAASRAAGPSAGFADRVMEAVRATPRTAAPPASPVRSAPPAPPVRLLPPLAPAPVLAWRTWAAAAAFAATAAAVAFVFLNGQPTPVPPTTDSGLEGRGTAVARNGGALRWPDRTSFDRGLAGSAWIAKDASSPTLSGEFLHSPAPSSIHVRLPGGGQINAGPLSWLTFGEDGTVALLEGALTATAKGGDAGDPAAAPVVLDSPGVHVESRGSVEMSVRVDGGAKAGARWFTARAEAVRTGAPPPAAPRVTVLVFARKGSAEVASSSGPVRNSLERHTLKPGQALFLRDSKVFLQMGVDDDAPPETASVLGGLPIPPDSLFFAGSALAPVAGGTVLSAVGPVRNSLERTLSDPTTDPEARADALAVFEGVGGLEAIEAAVKAVDDPAVQVRCAAVRILALNSDADRPAALAALRRLVKDPDSGVAVFAINALKWLDDRGAVEVLRTMVVDDDAPPEESQVAAFVALVRLGDVSRVAEAAARLGKLDQESVIGKHLNTAVSRAFERLPMETVRGYLADPRPGVRGAALFAARDVGLAKTALGDASPVVQLIAADVLLTSATEVDFESFRPLASGSVELRRGLIRRLAKKSESQQGSEVPGWVREFARTVLEDPGSNLVDCKAAALLLTGRAPDGMYDRLLSTGTSAQRVAILSAGSPSPAQVYGRLRDADGQVRRAAGLALAPIAWVPDPSFPATSALTTLEAFLPEDFDQARSKAMALAGLAIRGAEEGSLPLLVAMASSSNAAVRRASAFGLGPLGSRPDAASSLEKLLIDTDRETAEAAADLYARAVRKPDWAGKAPSMALSISSPFPVVRGQVALVARSAGNGEATQVLRQTLAGASSAARLRILKRVDGSRVPLDFVEPDTLVDPSPAVRLQVLLATTGPSRVEAARILSNDPAFWVQALALSILSKNGETTALEALRILVNDQVASALDTDVLLRGLDGAAEGLADHVTARVMAGSSSSGIGLHNADPDAVADALVLSLLADSRRHGTFLARAANPTERISAAGVLGHRQVTPSLTALARATNEAQESDPQVRDAAMTAIEELVGYRPMPTVSEWYRLHRRGYVGEFEVRARAGH